MDSNLEINANQIEVQEKTGQQLLGNFLITVGILNIAEIAGKLLIRAILGDTMLAGAYEVYLGVARLILIIVAFVLCIKGLNKLRFHAATTKKLVVLWGVILIPIQLINDMMVMLYTRMLELLQHVLIDSGMDEGTQIFAMIYDMTHGFKYVCIFLAILLGIVMTGELLEKRKLFIMSIVFAVLFVIAFTFFRMQSITVDAVKTFTIGINWTSMIFHCLTTFGLLSIGLYIYFDFKPEKPIEEN